MGEAADSGARGYTITHKGQTFEVALFDIDKVEMFERWLEERAWNAVEHLRHKITPEQYEKRLDIVAKQVASGVYSNGSPAYIEAMNSLPGKKFMTFLVLAEKNRGMTQELAAEIFTDQMMQLMAKMSAMEGDPNVPFEESPLPQNLMKEIASLLHKYDASSVTSPSTSTRPESGSSPSDRLKPSTSAEEIIKAE